MTEKLKNFLQLQLKDYKINLRNCDNKTIFNIVLFLKEGFKLPGETTDRIFEYAKEIINPGFNENVLDRINELNNGDINISDFANGEELAFYLLYGEK